MYCWLLLTTRLKLQSHILYLKSKKDNEKKTRNKSGMGTNDWKLEIHMPPAPSSNGVPRSISQGYSRSLPEWLNLARRHQPAGCMWTPAQMELEQGQFPPLDRWPDRLQIPTAWRYLDWVFTLRKGVCKSFKSPLGSRWPHPSNYAFKYSKWMPSKNIPSYIVSQYMSEQFVEWWRGRDHVTSPKKSESCRQES